MRNLSQSIIQILLCTSLLAAEPLRTPLRQNPEADASAPGLRTSSESLPLLRLGHPVERQLKGGKTHSYRIDLRAGEFLQVAVYQKGIDVITSVTGPDMSPLIEMRTPAGDRRPERVSLVAQTSGSYRVDVRSADKQAQRGPYAVAIASLRQAIPQDRDRIAAERLFIEGTLLLGDQTKEGFTGAIERYAKALILYRSAGDRGGEAWTLAYAGDAFV
jgi:hypothetical protein